MPTEHQNRQTALIYFGFGGALLLFSKNTLWIAGLVLVLLGLLRIFFIDDKVSKK